jgi:predicted dithiol-disulfide oxidoreductase (DUF899 family)
VAKGKLYYNYGEWPFASEEWPGISVFYKDDTGDIFTPTRPTGAAWR